jgi:predicted transcriptional regulator
MPATPKQHILKFVRELPDDASFDDIEQELLDNLRYARSIRAMVERGERDIEEGRTMSNEEFKEKRGIE